MLSSQKTVLPERNFIGKALNLGSLIDYQKNAVVSKQILNKKTGTLTVFAFDKGEGLSEHTAPYDASVFILKGRAVILIAGKPHALNAGEMIILPAQIPHAVKAPERFKMLLIMIRS